MPGHKARICSCQVNVSSTKAKPLAYCDDNIYKKEKKHA